MYTKLIKVETPRVFFNHELEQLSDEYNNRLTGSQSFFAFVDEQGKFCDKVLYQPYDLDNKDYWGDTICVMKRCVEEQYSQHIVDSCRKGHKKLNAKQYEWHLTKKPAVINTLIGECVFTANHEMDYVYVYDNLIYYCAHFGHKRMILNHFGKVIVNDIKELFNTKTHLIVHSNHDYRTRLDNIVCINKMTGEIEKEY